MDCMMTLGMERIDREDGSEREGNRQSERPRARGRAGARCWEPRPELILYTPKRPGRERRRNGGRMSDGVIVPRIEDGEDGVIGDQASGERD